MVSYKLGLMLMLTAGGVMGRSNDNLNRLNRIERRVDKGAQPGSFGNGGTDPLTHPAGSSGGNGGGAGGFGNGGTDPLNHPAVSSKMSASSGGKQMHWATDVSGMTGAEMLQHAPKGFFLGSSVDNPDLKDPKVAALTKYLPYVTPGNSLKMQFIYESENSWTELKDAVEKAAGKDTIKWKYHTLIWGAEQSKQMMQQSFSKEAMMKTITDFVSTKMCPKVMKEANFFAIDVLNEVMDDSGTGFKKNGYFEVIGEEGYKQVLKLVKQKCPDYKLIVNDYGMESLNPKSNFAFKTIKQWLAEGVPVDAVGLQFHIQLNNKYEDMLASIKRWTDEKIPVVLSEIDIPINLPPSKEDLEKQAQQYGNLMQAALEGGAFGATFWGLMDSHTWFGTQQEQGVGHGKTGAPLLFDAQGKPKPAVAAIVDVFKKWGDKPAGIEGGRATDLGAGSSSSSSASSGTTGAGSDASTGASTGASSGSADTGVVGGDANADAGAGSQGPTGYGSNAGKSKGKGKGKGNKGANGASNGSASASGDDSAPADGSGSASGSGSGSSSTGSGSGNGSIDMGPPDTGSASSSPDAGSPGSSGNVPSGNGPSGSPNVGSYGSHGGNGLGPGGVPFGNAADGAPQGYAPQQGKKDHHNKEHQDKRDPAGHHHGHRGHGHGHKKGHKKQHQKASMESRRRR